MEKHLNKIKTELAEKYCIENCVMGMVTDYRRHSFRAGFDAAVTALSECAGEFDVEQLKRFYENDFFLGKFHEKNSTALIPPIAYGDFNTVVFAALRRYAQSQHAQLAPQIAALKNLLKMSADASVNAQKEAETKLTAQENLLRECLSFISSQPDPILVSDLMIKINLRAEIQKHLGGQK
jgi:hypothetical protein